MTNIVRKQTYLQNKKVYAAALIIVCYLEKKGLSRSITKGVLHWQIKLVISNLKKKILMPL